VKLLLAVAAGGALGSLGRYLLSGQMGRLLGLGFPWGTLAVNILGSLAMGLLVAAMALRWNASAELRAFLTIGILGGFTTFSAFSLEVVLLLERGQWVPAAAYVVASVALSVGGLFLGLLLMRQALA